MTVRKKGSEEKPKNVPLADVIAQEAEAAKRAEFGSDDLFDPSRDLNHSGPFSFRQSMQDRDAIVIDDLLAGLPKNQGYYLKLYKEILPGQYEFKMKIDKYDTWSDLELEVAELVKSMTRKLGSKKWGSGVYRLNIWKNGGIRDREKYPPIDVVVDAGDEVDGGATVGRVDPVEAANEQLQALGNMLNAVRGIMPAAPDPNVQFQAIAQAFAQGKDDKKSNDQLMMQMMMTMMTTMMTSMKDLALAGRQPDRQQPQFEDQMARMMEIMRGFGVIGQQSQPKSLAENLADLKLLGLDPFKKDDAIDQLAKMKALFSTVTDLVPNGQPVERPGLFEKLVDSLAPHIPKMIGDIKNMSDNAALVQKMHAQRLAEMSAMQTNGETPQPVRQKIPMEERPRTSYGQPVGPVDRMGASDAFSHEPDMDPYSGFKTHPLRNGDARVQEHESPKQEQTAPVQAEPSTNAVETLSEMEKFLQQLSALILDDRRDAYPALYATLDQQEESRALLNGIRAKLVNADFIIEQLKNDGGPTYNHPPFVEKMRSYFNGFIDWILENENGPVQAICELCSAKHAFESKGHFMSIQKICGLDAGGGRQCTGQLALVANETKK